MYPNKPAQRSSVQPRRANRVDPHSDRVHHRFAQRAIGTGRQSVRSRTGLTVSSRSSELEALPVAATRSNSDSSLARVSGVE